MEPPEVHGDDEIADANPHVDADHGEDGVAPKGPRAIPAQYTPAELKTYMPFRCQHKGVNITLDDLKAFRYIATYDHREFALEVDPNIIDNLPTFPVNFKRYSHDPGTFGPDATAEEKSEKLEAALKWAWDKHKHMFDEERPVDAYQL